MSLPAGLMVLATVVLGGGVAQAAQPVNGPSTGDVTIANADNRCDNPLTGYFCFYENAGFGGKYQVFAACGEHDLYYRDEVSSSKHRQYGGAWVEVMSYPPSEPESLWTMHGTASATGDISYVGDRNNDKADYFINRCP